MNNSIQPIIRWTARIWAVLSIAFLLLMIGGHIFGNEPQQFSNSKEIIGAALFPVGVLLGLAIGLKIEKLGGLLATGSMVAFFCLAPNAISGIWFWLTALPGVLFLIVGFWPKTA